MVEMTEKVRTDYITHQLERVTMYIVKLQGKYPTFMDQDQLHECVTDHIGLIDQYGE